MARPTVVPDESGARVPNPISLVSRWKILDNLRRSLVEPATFALLLFGWFVMGHPVLWTLAAICILFVPAWVEFVFRFGSRHRPRAGREWPATLSSASSPPISPFFSNLTLLAHQTLLVAGCCSARAWCATWLRASACSSGKPPHKPRLGERSTPVDRYIDWMPFLAIGLACADLADAPAVIAWLRLPILALWACSKAPRHSGSTLLRIEPRPRLEPARIPASAQDRFAYLAILRRVFRRRNTTGSCPTTLRRSAKGRGQRIPNQRRSSSECAPGRQPIRLSHGSRDGGPYSEDP